MKIYEHKYGISEYYYNLEYAAKLHDVGKICIPDHIIQKLGKLTSDELDEVKTHSSIAADIIKKLAPGNRITPIIKHHHEKYYGSGYSDRLKGTDIAVGSRVITIADSFDAMRSNRPYRKGLSLGLCIAEIRDNKGTQFDPELVDAFFDLLETGSI